MGSTRERLAPAWLLAAALLAGCTPSEDPALSAQLAALEARAKLRSAPLLEGDLRSEARQVIARLRAGLDPYLGSPATFAGVTLPPSLRVWRKSLGSTASCSGQVDVIPFEEYVKGVLPHEWIPSWEVESLRAGAIAIRSYAAAWVAKGGKYTCADLDDTTSSQVYKDDRNAKASQAVDDTRGLVVVENNVIVFAEYSAENGDPTKFNVSDPPCAGKTLFGHGRGMCQWGSQRWALQAKGHVWIAEHYYPNSKVTSTLPIDAGPPPTPDLGPTPDLVAPTPDQHVTADLPTAQDGPTAPDDRGIKRIDLRLTGADQGTSGRSGLSGGCQVDGAGGASPSLLLLLALALIVRLRKQL